MRPPFLLLTSVSHRFHLRLLASVTRGKEAVVARILADGLGGNSRSRFTGLQEQNMTRKRGPWVLRGITPVVVLALLGSVFAAHGIAEERLPHREGGGPGGWRGHEIEHWQSR
jgi:hypothetical protein